MTDHDGHTVNVGPVTVGETVTMADPIDIDAIRRRGGDVTADHVLALCDEVDRLRDLLAKALPWIEHNATLRGLLAKALPHIDPNDSDDAHLLTVAIRDALDAVR